MIPTSNCKDSSTPIEASNKNVLVLDSSQISNFLDCNQLWWYQNIERLGFEHEQEKQAMNAGTYGHKMLEIYYRARAEGLSFDSAAAKSYDFDPDQELCTCGCAAEFHNLPSITENATLECANSEVCNCVAFTAKPFSLTQDLRYSVRTRFREYLYKYTDNDFIPNSPDSVEVGFSEPIYEDRENLFVLEGRIDMLGTWQGLPTIVDHKFQLRKRDLYKKSIQFRNYALIADVNMLVVNYIRLTDKVDKTTLVRDISSFNAPEHRWWRSELIKIFFKISEQRKLPPDEKDKNWGMCSGKYGYECAYTQLCTESDLEMKVAKKETLYTIKKEWRPW